MNTILIISGSEYRSKNSLFFAVAMSRERVQYRQTHLDRQCHSLAISPVWTQNNPVKQIKMRGDSETEELHKRKEEKHKKNYKEGLNQQKHTGQEGGT